MSYQILLVDDDDDFREELCDLLSHYKIIEASSGEQALNIIRKPHALDLVILDVVMPGLRGTDVLKEIKKVSPNLSIIMLTGNSSKDTAIEALKGRADDYIEKPFEPNKFQKTIERILASRRNTGGGNPGKMERAKNFLKTNYDKKVSLKDVAQELCLSPKYLSRIFKEKTGKGFNDFRLEIKIQVEQDILKSDQVSVQEVADKLGYKNLESFTRIFKKVTGATPTEFRENPKNYAKSKKISRL